MSTLKDIVRQVDGYLIRTGTSERALGIAAVGCNKTVGRLRMGRARLSTVDVLEKAMRRWPSGVTVNRAGQVSPIQAPVSAVDRQIDLVDC